ncbi:hypothetical protein E05_18930 [Plautia stali symbiont]|nr:hypothetical protein E05_18930 [Plautia stali symbiont]
MLGVVLGSLVQVLIPRRWLLRLMGSNRLGATLVGTGFGLPGMMCSCCAEPVTVGLRQAQVSSGAAMAFWLANPLLNPATLVFMGFVLGWQFAAIRLVAGWGDAAGHCHAGAAQRAENRRCRAAVASRKP